MFILPLANFQKPHPKHKEGHRIVVVVSWSNQNNIIPSIQQWSTRCPWWLQRSPARSKVPSFFWGSKWIYSWFPVFCWFTFFFWNAFFQLFGFQKMSSFFKLLLEKWAEMTLSNPTISESLLHSGWSNSLLGLVMAILTLTHKSTSFASWLDLTWGKTAIYNTITVSF